MDDIGKLWEEHPFAVAGGVFVIGLILIYYFFSGSSSSASTTDPTGYYAAQSAAIQSGNSLAALYSNNATQAAIADAQVKAIEATVSGNVATAQSTNAAAENIAVTNATSVTHQSDNTLAGLLAGYKAQVTASQSADAAATQIAGIAANQAITIGSQQVAINAANVGGAETINAQNVGGAVAINAANIGGAETINAQNIGANEFAVGSYERITAAQNSLAFWRPGTVSSLVLPGGYGQTVATPGNAANPIQPQGAAYT